MKYNEARIVSSQPLHALSRVMLNQDRASPVVLARSPEQVMLSLITSAAETAEPARRSRIWDLAETLHCSIIGTCLSTAELRSVLHRLGVPGAKAADEHETHMLGVMLASRREAGAKVLNKALDRRHAAAIKHYARAKDEASLLTLWRQSVQNGDIPGAYWAVLTHPAATQAIVKKAFGDVHMLSHLVGAANRADIRRLSALEAENTRLHDKVARQQAQLREQITARDDRIRALNELLARGLADRPVVNAPDEPALTALVANLEHRLRGEFNRRLALEERLAEAQSALAAERRERERLAGSEQTLREELQAVESALADSADDAPPETAASVTGRSLLYVGGRTDRVGHLRRASERLGAELLHHDGGVDERSGLLAGLVSRADLVLFPVDCVSHEAVILVKRLCRQMDKPYVPLRSNGLASFTAALTRPAVPPEP